MAYVVRIAERAERDLFTLYQQINAASSIAAQTWYTGLKNAILTLAELPKRCPVTPENPRLRHLLYGHKPYIYRVIYRIDERRRHVDVLHIRHGAQRKFGATDMR